MIFFFFSTTSHHHHGKKLVSLQQQRQPKNDILERRGCQRRCILLTINEQFLDSLITISLKRSNLLSVSPRHHAHIPKVADISASVAGRQLSHTESRWTVPEANSALITTYSAQWRSLTWHNGLGNSSRLKLQIKKDNQILQKHWKEGTEMEAWIVFPWLQWEGKKKKGERKKQRKKRNPS